MNNVRALVAVCLGCGMFTGALAGEYALSADAEGTRGDYGTGSETTVGTVTLGLQYQGERFGWSLAVPWLVVSGPSDVVVSGGMVHGGGQQGQGGGGSGSASTSGTRTTTGVGDITLGAGLTIVEEGTAAPFLGLSGKVKFGTADETRSLGTGENDYSLQVEAAKEWLNGRVGYRWLGDSENADYENVAYGVLGLTHRFTGGGDLGLEYLVEEATVAGAEMRRELTVYGSHPLSDAMQLRGYLLKGFGDASPDVGLGVGIVANL